MKYTGSKSAFKKGMPKRRFYFWEWCEPYGWRPMARLDGYDSKKELMNDTRTQREMQEEDGKPWMITMAVIAEKHGF